MKRKLASIQTISDIHTIKDADMIECATVLGWHVVIKKDEFHVGDRVIYCEIDSVLPDKPEFTFLDPTRRIKTACFRGQVSQGICFPLSLLPTGEYNIGDDVSEILQIKKYERPLDFGGESLKAFPGFLHQTTEFRIQIIQDILLKYNGTAAYITEKIDGVSTTMYFNEDYFGVCSHSVELLESENSDEWAIARDNNIEDKLKAFCKSKGVNIAAQGELIGPGIQNNKYKLKKHEWRLFNCFNIDTHKIGSLNDLLELSIALGIQTVPILNDNYIINADSVDDIVEMSKGKSLLAPIKREGIVIRSTELITDRALGRLSFKVINPNFLLKYKDD